MTQIITHPTGNEFVRALLAECTKRAIDFHFFTTLGFTPGAPLLQVVPRRLRAQLSRRAFEVPKEQLDTHPWRETVRLMAKGLRINSLVRHERGWASTDRVFQDFDAHVGRQIRRIAKVFPVKSVHAYEDSAIETFQAAREVGAQCSYELPIAYWETARRLLGEEARRWPEWEPTLQATADSPDKRERKTAELELADTVICPSRFVLNSVPAKHRDKCRLAPFGSPALSECKPLPSAPQRPLRVLFAGTLSQRKGLADLFAAFQRLKRKDVELVVMGTPMLPMPFYRRQYPDFIYEPPRPHDEVLRLMQQCDLLALPSIVEGRALVQQEAMAAGLPIIVTPNAGGEDLVEEGRTGFLVPIRSPERLVEKIAWGADHREEIAEMGRLARQKAATLTWGHYASLVMELWER